MSLGRVGGQNLGLLSFSVRNPLLLIVLYINNLNKSSYLGYWLHVSSRGPCDLYFTLQRFYMYLEDYLSMNIDRILVSPRGPCGLQRYYIYFEDYLICEHRHIPCGTKSVCRFIWPMF